jgi:SAM-dependent methyltransferase
MPHGHAEQAASFGRAAREYEQGRPGYPDAALDWLLPGGARDVVDLGAGTGKLTRQLADRNLTVVAVEPSEEMRGQLRSALPGVTALAGAAEHIPLPDDSADAVLVAQAWHWVEPAVAVPEVARVLRPGGRLGLVWNVRDESVGWVAELGRSMRSIADDPTLMSVELGAAFGPVEQLTVPWQHRTTPDGLRNLVASRSYVITAPPAQRSRVLREVDQLLADHPDLAGRNEFDLPYLTTSFRAAITAAS